MTPAELAAFARPMRPMEARARIATWCLATGRSTRDLAECASNGRATTLADLTRAQISDVLGMVCLIEGVA